MTDSYTQAVERCLQCVKQNFPSGCKAGTTCDVYRLLDCDCTPHWFRDANGGLWEVLFVGIRRTIRGMSDIRATYIYRG